MEFCINQDTRMKRSTITGKAEFTFPEERRRKRLLVSSVRATAFRAFNSRAVRRNRDTRCVLSYSDDVTVDCA
jgi:hypothetical protein